MYFWVIIHLDRLLPLIDRTKYVKDENRPQTWVFRYKVGLVSWSNTTQMTDKLSARWQAFLLPAFTEISLWTSDLKCFRSLSTPPNILASAEITHFCNCQTNQGKKKILQFCTVVLTKSNCIEWSMHAHAHIHKYIFKSCQESFLFIYQQFLSKSNYYFWRLDNQNWCVLPLQAAKQGMKKNPSYLLYNLTHKIIS